MTQIQFNTKLQGLQDELYYYALKLTTNNEKAKDLIQETFLKGYKYNEIAEELELQMGTVKSRIFFARRKLQKALID